eukprot:scaffold447553_cov14-Prasinocladus_malaysianus.AAC.1
MNACRLMPCDYSDQARDRRSSSADGDMAVFAAYVAAAQSASSAAAAPARPDDDAEIISSWWLVGCCGQFGRTTATAAAKLAINMGKSVPERRGLYCVHQRAMTRASCRSSPSRVIMNKIITLEGLERHDALVKKTDDGPIASISVGPTSSTPSSTTPHSTR